MRGLLQAILILSISAFSAGCDDDSDRSDRTASQFSYSVLTSDSGRGTDLLEEFNTSAWPKLRKAGAQKYGVWSSVPGSSSQFEKIAEDELVVMLRWRQVKVARISEALEAITDVSDVTTSFDIRADFNPQEVQLKTQNNA